MSSKNHKQSVSELKLRRLTEHNSRLKEDLQRPRVKVSEASDRLVPLSPFLSSFIFFSCSLLRRLGLCIRTGGWLLPRGTTWARGGNYSDRRAAPRQPAAAENKDGAGGLSLGKGSTTPPLPPNFPPARMRLKGRAVSLGCSLAEEVGKFNLEDMS